MPLPTARFPGAIAGAADLLIQGNVVPSQAGSFPTLIAALAASATSFMVSSGYGQQLPADNFEVSIDDEIIFVALRSGDTLSNCVRGAEGTTPSAHNAGAAVLANYTAKAHNQDASEIIAVETLLKGPQAQGAFYAGPSASSGAPTYRAIVSGDLPAALVGSQAAAEFFASPTAAAGAPAFRVLAGGDLPNPLNAGDVNGVYFYSVTYDYTVNAPNQVIACQLPQTNNRIYLMSAAYSTADGTGKGSDHLIAWLVGTWGAYPASVFAPQVSSPILSVAYDNAMTSRVSCVGAINTILNFTCTGYVAGYPAYRLKIRGLAINYQAP
jgi:hypothetical protein